MHTGMEDRWEELSDSLTRRRMLLSGKGTLAGLSGCLGNKNQPSTKPAESEGNNQIYDFFETASDWVNLTAKPGVRHRH